MPAPTTTPTTTPVISPNEEPWPSQWTAPERICPAQTREVASPDVAP